MGSLPLAWSTVATFNGHLLSVGGRDDLDTTSNVYRYNFYTDSWILVSQMKNRRSMTLAVSLPGEDRLVVVGGVFAGFKQTDTIEVLE